MKRPPTVEIPFKGSEGRIAHQWRTVESVYRISRGCYGVWLSGGRCHEQLSPNDTLIARPSAELSAVQYK